MSFSAPMNDQNGQLCGLTGPTMEFTSVDQLQEPWLAYKGMIPDVFHLPDDQIYIRADAARAVAGLAFDETEGATSLYNTLKDAQEPPTWMLAGAPDFSHDGICAGGQDNDFAKDFGFPRAYPHPAFPDGVWVHRREIPTTWEAYEPRARWLRTPNDSLLTEAVSLRDGEILDEALGGTIHPTAQGQAAVADELFEAAQPSVPPK